jgi:hypothetical protein
MQEYAGLAVWSLLVGALLGALAFACMELWK